MITSIETSTSRPLIWMLAAIVTGAPSIVLRFSGVHLDPLTAVVIFGIGILSGAFLLSWAGEAAQVDVSASLAIAVLALIAVLPEYSIEAVLAWKAGASFDTVAQEITPRMELVSANVTGANRLLIGLGWSVVIIIFWIKRRRALDLRGTLSLEIIVLTAATLLTFLIFFMNSVHIVLASVLITTYLIYLWFTSRQSSEEPELMGPSLLIGSLPVRQRRTVVLAFFLYAAFVIITAAEPFVESLVETGTELGVSEFLLIQWIAPLASESPEIAVAVLFVMRSHPGAALITLISAEISQLTLLIGSMVIIFSISAGELLSFPLDHRQSAEFLLTSAMSAFAIMLIFPRLVGWKTGGTLLALFITHLFFVDPDYRLIFAYIFLVLTVCLIVWHRRKIRQMLRIG